MAILDAFDSGIICKCAPCPSFGIHRSHLIRYGDSIGTLNVYLFNGTYQRIWTLSGNRGNNWYEGQASYTSSSLHRIVVEGIAGKDYLVSRLRSSIVMGMKATMCVFFFQGDISIDDFTFTTSNCSVRPLNQAVPTVETTIPAALLTTTIGRSTLAPQSPWDCDFEKGVLCPTWSHDVSANFRWELKQGQTPSFNTGPTAGK